MKKIIITYLLFLNCIPSHCDIWSSIISKGIQAGEKINDVVGDAKSFFQNQLPGCAEVVGLGTAYGTAKAALETANFAVDSAEVVGRKTALDGAKGVLEGAKQSSVGVLNLANAIAKGLDKAFNITCIKFYGSVEELEFEVRGIIAGKSIMIKEKVDVSDIESFAKKIFNILQNEAKKIF